MSSDLLLLAYIDPATGGLVLGGLGAGCFAWFFVALLFVRRKLVSAAKAVAAFARRHPAASSAVAAGLVTLAVGAVSGYGFGFTEGAPMNSPQPAARRVLAIGVDGADPRMIQAMFDRGQLPHLASVAERGSFHPLEVPNPAQSPVVWAALATGQNPGHNGIFDFIGRDPKEYRPQLSLLESSKKGGRYAYPIRATAFWDVTTAHQVPATIVRWPMTFPPPEIHGRMLAGLGVPDVRGGLGRYSFFTDAADAREGEEGGGVVVRVSLDGGGAGAADLPGPQVRAMSGVKTLTTPLELKVDREARKVQVTLGGRALVLREGEWSDLVELTFTSGLFSKYRALTRLHLRSASGPFALLATSVEMHPAAPVVPFAHPPEYARELRDAIGHFHTLGMPEDTKAFGNDRMDEAAYLALCDRVEGERRAMLLHELGRFDRGVLAVVFDTLDRIQHMTPIGEDVADSAAARYLRDFDGFLGTVLKRLPSGTEVIVFSDHGFSEFHHAVDLNRWLAQAGELSVDEDAFRARKEGTSGELYRFVRWADTRAYAVGFAGIYVNVRGREGQGVVPPEERRAVAERVRQGLEALVDPSTGERIVHRAYLREELYEGQALDEAPDVVIGFRPGYRGSWQSAIGGLSEQVISPNEKRWQRDHIVDASFVSGTLLTSFKVNADRPHAYDLAPTILGLLELPVPDQMRGRPLHRDAGRVRAPRANVGGGAAP